MKVCKKCNVEKQETKEFFFFRNSTMKFESPCKQCVLESKKEYNNKNKEKILNNAKTYRENNKATINSKRKDAYSFYKLTIDDYKKKNKDKIDVKRRENRKNKYHNDPEYKLRHTISVLIRHCLTKNNKSYVKYIPYSIQKLKQHLESQFEPWMSWKNWGKYNVKTWNDNDQSTWKWHIDHIMPQSDLPYTSMEDDNFNKCWSLENLRPYSAKQNVIDGAIRVRHK